MNLPARSLDHRRPVDRLDVFTRRCRPLLDEALADTLEVVPPGLGPVQGATARALGLDGRQGRRWRPLLTLAVSEAVGGSADGAINAAVAVELTHTASLVLDDMPCMDDSPERRGEPATHALLGSAGAILIAVGLLARAAELLGESGTVSGELARSWGRTFGLDGMAGGQAVDLIRGGDCRGAMRRLYRKKTTGLAVFAVEAGARTGGASEETLATLLRFGGDVGWAYQLVDDAKDRVEDRAAGRAPGGRNPLRQAARLLDRGRTRVRSLEDLAPGGDALLSALAADIVRIPPLATLNPDPEAAPC